MTTSPSRIERRVGQRFSYLLPISIRQTSTGLEGAGFTQDLSSKGVFFFTDLPLLQGTEIEVTLRMPSEITLGESMLVRCRGRILRVAPPVAGLHGAETKIGVAMRLDGYEYLVSESRPRTTALHSPETKERDVDHVAVRS
jgi:hypothetical protein